MFGRLGIVEAVMGTRQNLTRITLGVALAALAGLLFYLPFSGAIAGPALQGTPTPSPSPGARADTMYFFGAEGLVRSNPDGSGAESVLSEEIDMPTDFAADVQGGKVYWADAGPPVRIQRANLDGTDVETVIILEPGASAPPLIRKAGLGGGGMEGQAAQVFSPIVPLSIALDVDNDKIYWTNGDGQIIRADLDGTDIEVVVSRIPGAPLLGLVLDVEDGKIYWSSRDDATNLRANLDGSDIEVLVELTEPGDAALDLELDLRRGKIYWTNLSGKIQRADLDGTDVEVVVAGIGSPFGIALELAIDRVYWTEPDTGIIWWARLDGTDVEIVVTGLTQPRDVLLVALVR